MIFLKIIHLFLLVVLFIAFALGGIATLIMVWNKRTPLGIFALSMSFVACLMILDIIWREIR